MKWAFSIKHKMTAALLLTLVLVLMLGTVIIDKRSVSRLESAFASVYEDRLLVESYIYHLADHLYRKKIMIESCVDLQDAGRIRQQLQSHNEAIQVLLSKYEETRFTQTETSRFNDLKQNIRTMETLEADYLDSEDFNQPLRPSLKAVEQQFVLALDNLHALSGIQVEEGKGLHDDSHRVIAGFVLLSHFEIVILIGIGILIQILLFAAKTTLPKFPQKPSMN